MSELRQDRTTGDWVIVAPGRGQRPRRFSGGAAGTIRGPHFDPACPFCPGNETQLPGILAEIPAAAASGWQVRVVPNKYPAVCSDGRTAVVRHDRHRVIGAYGFHEVVIESPRHDADLVSISGVEMEAVISAYWRRFSQLHERAGVGCVILFRNHGKAGGASLSHPHAQLVALGSVPPWLSSVTDWARQKYGERSSCVTCEEVALERSHGKRIVEENRSFIAAVPFAATVPFEVWLVPKQHQSSFAEIDETGRRDLGVLLQRTLRRLWALHGDPPYNFVVDSACKENLREPYVHWRMRIAPDLIPWGGFELGTHMPINPSSPEEDAAALRSTAPVETAR